MRKDYIGLVHQHGHRRVLLFWDANIAAVTSFEKSSVFNFSNICSRHLKFRFIRCDDNSANGNCLMKNVL